MKQIFIRELSDDLIKKLKTESLFIKCLLPDIQKGAVFPAIRNGYIDFYYKGRRLFHYDGEFSTHIKYASVLIRIGNGNKDYLKESSFPEGVSFPKSFEEVYDRIKENCWNYTADEAEGVSELYKFSPFATPDRDIVLLDIEVAFANQETMDAFKSDRKHKKTNRIDILLYNKKSSTLHFIEAKHFSNGEIKTEVSEPKVNSQMERYNDEIYNKKQQIFAAYVRYIEILNSLFGTSIKKPINLSNKCGLYVFGFGNPDKSISVPSIKAKIIKRHKTYFIGNPSGTKINTLWNATYDCDFISRRVY